MIRIASLPALVLIASAPAAAQVDPVALAATFDEVCLSGQPPGLVAAQPSYVETDTRETFAGPADRYWLNEAETIRFDITFTTTTLSCEFVVDLPAVGENGLQQFTALSLLAIQSAATRSGAVAEATLPENIPTFRWTATPDNFTGAFDHLVEVTSSPTQTLIRSAIEIRRP